MRKCRAMNRSTMTPSDPMPEAPQQPDIDECCGNGCSPCIFDTHDLAMDRYRQDLRAWRARQADGESG
jgi:hypothetical protein